MERLGFVSASRFDRQERFAPLGAEGQARLARSRVLVVGCGALGGALAQSMVRSGVGTVRIVDRDIVEESNLPRQVLFEPQDIGQPKALVAARALGRVGGPARIEPHVRHLDGELLRELAADVDLVLDGTDNLATRYLVNDHAVERGRSWVYGGVVGSSGLVFPVVPPAGACLRCLFPDPPPPGALPTCDSAGVIQPAVAAIAALQAGVALRLLGSPRERRTQTKSRLIELDVWSLECHGIDVPRDPDCPCCARREFSFLDADTTGEALSLCGRRTVQVRPSRSTRARIDLVGLKARLATVAQDAALLDGLLRFRIEDITCSVFPDGRALFEGTDDPLRARALYDRWLGS
ncbi:MAG: thiazole biosynthesis adenylyltransferase ThiF [Planctomycetes bacterium]|nr:thiazole biosynthesis adenylyltransferase ThiF [Planctomycetota bacterium]